MSHTNASHNQMNAENQNIEYKESWRDEYLKWICGFANAQGGKTKLHEPHASNARNKNIAFAFYKAGFIEAWGRGISKIVTQFTAEGLKEPKFEDFCGGVRVTIYRNTDLVAETIEKNNGEDVENVNGVIEKRVEISQKNNGKVTENDSGVTKKVTENIDGVTKKVTNGVTNEVVERVTENQKVILDEIGKNAIVTIQQLADILHISIRKTKQNIAKLKDKGLIQHVGSNRSGHWEIIKLNNNN